MKKRSLKSLKKKAWKLMSEYIRRRWAVNNIVACFTCDKRAHWKTMDCGHFKHGNHMNWEINNLAPQCGRCNRYLHGRLDVFAARLIQKYGHEVLDELEYKANQAPQYDRMFMDQLIENLENKLARL